MLVGGSGVGKREVGGGVGEGMFGDENGVIGMDMCEYGEKEWR